MLSKTVVLSVVCRKFEVEKSDFWKNCFYWNGACYNEDFIIYMCE